MFTVEKIELNHEKFKVNALDFRPEGNSIGCAIFSHGYTAHKGSILSWAHRLVESGISVLLFDLPGHYLGSYNDLGSFEDFTEHAHKLFYLAHKQLGSPDKLILGGHSLGALLSLKALACPELEQVDTLNICVGLGDGIQEKNHIFESDLYKSALTLRNELVSKHIHSDKVFPWIKEEKLDLVLPGKKIHLIVGKDDLVVPQAGAKKLYDRLSKKGSEISFSQPEKLAHHHPENAAGLIKAYLKKEGLL